VRERCSEGPAKGGLCLPLASPALTAFAYFGLWLDVISELGLPKS
jgi:hypothetical protein